VPAVIEENGKYVNPTGPEKESSQNPTGGISPGSAPFRKLSVRRSSLRTCRLEADGPAGPSEVYGK
jgi:hypothetical protein